MSLLEDVKLALRITGDDLDSEITDVIAACKMDLQLAGIILITDDDPLIKRAVILYAKANVGYDEDSDKYQRSYDALKMSLSLAGDYNDRGMKK
ncbi:MAG: head-tail connector protein [Clostridiales bacterium]|jgi:hypothetical protein|nr:head-tail connector protein [Clostridiales bacterium]